MPTDRADVGITAVAVPGTAELSGTPEAITPATESVKVTVPVGVQLLAGCDATVTVKVTCC